MIRLLLILLCILLLFYNNKNKEGLKNKKKNKKGVPVPKHTNTKFAELLLQTKANSKYDSKFKN
jgi:hypothetical protein